MSSSDTLRRDRLAAPLGMGSKSRRAVLPSTAKRPMILVSIALGAAAWFAVLLTVGLYDLVLRSEPSSVSSARRYGSGLSYSKGLLALSNNSFPSPASGPGATAKAAGATPSPYHKVWNAVKRKPKVAAAVGLLVAAIVVSASIVSALLLHPSPRAGGPGNTEQHTDTPPPPPSSPKIGGIVGGVLGTVLGVILIFLAIKFNLWPRLRCGGCSAFVKADGKLEMTDEEYRIWVSELMVICPSGYEGDVTLEDGKGSIRSQVDSWEYLPVLKPSLDVIKSIVTRNRNAIGLDTVSDREITKEFSIHLRVIGSNLSETQTFTSLVHLLDHFSGFYPVLFCFEDPTLSIITMWIDSGETYVLVPVADLEAFGPQREQFWLDLYKLLLRITCKPEFRNMRPEVTVAL